MNLSIDSYLAYFRYDPEGFQRLIDRLQTMGYQPLVRKAAQSFSDIFGGKAEWRADLLDSDDNEESQHLSELNRRRLLSLEKLGYGWGIGGIRGLAKVPGLKGELFNSLDGNGMLFLSVLEFDKSTDSGEDHPTAALRAGLVGDMASGGAELNNFLTAIAEFLFENGSDIEWEQDQVESQQYREFTAAQDKAGFAYASTLPVGDLHAARELENLETREVAQLVRKYGTILARDLVSQSNTKGIDARDSIDRLTDANLLRQEYIVVCSKTGNHVNRAESREMIKQMGKLGLLCSCGEHITDELIEGVVSPDPVLLRLLEKSNWLSAAIVRVLASLGVPSERVILNPSLNGEDAEVLTDIGGMLLMFGLQDNEFALPQALNFGSRIALHRPQLAFVVAGRGITNEAKDHFKRLKHDTQLVYVSNLDELEPTVKEVVEDIRLNRVRAMFSALQSMVNFNITPLISSKFGSTKTARSISTSEKAPVPVHHVQAPLENTQHKPIVTQAPAAHAPVPHIEQTPVHNSAPAHQAPAERAPIVTPPPAPVQHAPELQAPVERPAAIVQQPAPVQHIAPAPTPAPIPVQHAAPASAPVAPQAPVQHTAPTPVPQAAPAPQMPPSPPQAPVHHVNTPTPTHSIPVRTVQVADDFDAELTHNLPPVMEDRRQPKSRPAAPEHHEVPAHAVEAEVVSESTPSEMASERPVFAMSGPVAESAPAPVPSHNPVKANSVDTADTIDSLANAISADHAPASVTIYEEAPEVRQPQPVHQAPEPQVYAMPGPVAREHAASFETSAPESAAQPYFEGQSTADSAPKGQDAWDSLSSILANAAAKETPAPVESHSLAESLPHVPRPNAALKLSLFGGHDDDDDAEFEQSHHSGEHHMTEEQEEERRNKAAAIRGLRHSS